MKKLIAKLKWWFWGLFYESILEEKNKDIEVLEARIKSQRKTISDLKSKLDNHLDVENFYLRKYVKESCSQSFKKCSEVLGDDSALMAFSKLWEDNKSGLMMMITSLEYEFMHTEEFTPDSLAALRHALGNVALFFQYSHAQYEERKMIEAAEDL